MKYFPFFVALMVTSCASSNRMISIEYQFVDIPEERRIELIYENSHPKTVCLLPESWPNQGGKINQASEYVFLVIGGERFPLVDFNTGYCPEEDGCAIYVAPGEEISASISYGDFNVPEDLINTKKRLDFSPVAFECRAKK